MGQSQHRKCIWWLNNNNNTDHLSYINTGLGVDKKWHFTAYSGADAIQKQYFTESQFETKNILDLLSRKVFS